MEVKRFRNHVSSVIEQFGALIVAIFIIIFGSVDDVIEIAEEISLGNAEETGVILAAAGIFILIIFVFIAWRFWVWSRTWVVIEEETITLEKNTLNSKKNTIGLKNISNVNTEQNIFEMIMGTCKVKLDTNSLSTANSTDVKIILKKKQAEELRAYLVKRINEINNGVDSVEAVSEFKDSEYDVKADLKDILLNGIYSINIAVILTFIGSFLFFIAGIMEIVNHGVHTESISGILGAIAIAFIMVATTLSGLVAGFVKLYGFMSKRDGDRIYIKYGLFKRVNYAIPVDKINAIIIHQTLIARVFHKYTAELVNVGMDDEKDSTASFTFYGSKEKLMDVIDKIIPEFSEAINFDVKRQPKSVWIVKAIQILCTLLFVLAIAAVGHIVTEMPWWISGIMIAVFMLFVIFGMIMSYITVGNKIQTNYLGLKSGIFGTHYVIIKFDKVQYITLNQNIITKKLGIVKGTARILASLGKVAHTIPYIREEECTSLVQEMSDWKN